MDALQRLRTLTSQMDLEPAEDAGCPKLSPRQQDAVNVSSAVMPNGKRIALLKTLLTSACERNCFYCPFRAGRDFRRASLKPEEMAQTFIAMQRAGLVQGLFLSSGVAGSGVRTQDQLIATSEILRLKYRYNGYLHLKLMPGAERDQVERAMQLSNRVSINLEAPNKQRLGRLAPHKDFLEELLQPLRWVDEIRHSQPATRGWKGRWPSSTTQFVVGAVGDTDLELLSTTDSLNRNLHLGRAYYSAFNPIAGTPFEDLPPTLPSREHHLYQASFLLRDYGFDLEDLPFDGSGALPADRDPKLAWAEANLAENPLEINQASFKDLLRIPGIGPKGANAILAARGKGTLRGVEDLGKLGIHNTRLEAFVLMDGKRPGRQMTLW